MMMKHFSLFAIFAISCELLIANTVSAYPGSDHRTEGKNLHESCPKIDKGTATLLPHESDCTAYYMCQSGAAILKFCPHDLHFNPKKKVCDFPERAGCTLEEEEEVFRSAGIPHSDCPSEDPDEPVILPHESYCTMFYICRHGLAYEKTCQFDLHFNAKLRVCDYPENAKCDLSFSEQKDDKQPKCPKINKSTATLLPHESDCTQYYICESGVPILRYCPDDLHFNPKKMVCDFSDRAGCSHKRGVSKREDDRQSKCPKINKSIVTLLPHETDCTQYYICESGEPILRFCPDELHFNPKSLVCDFPERAGCTHKAGELHTHLAAPEATGSPSPFCPTINGKNPIFFPHSTNCSVYYMCGNGLAYEFTCPSGLHFNVRLKTCDFPFRAKCTSQGF